MSRPTGWCAASSLSRIAKTLSAENIGVGARIHLWGNGRAMKDIPVAHAQWIGAQLQRLTNDQLHAAFRAADYDQTTAEAYIRELRERIKQLAQLPGTYDPMAAMPK